MNRSDRPSILLVDDDVDICRNLSDILTDLGYEVDYAHDGLSALEMVRNKPYDVALLDLKMPGMDGLTLYRQIKKERAGTVAMLVTAYAGPATAEDALNAGAWKVVAKPVDISGLLGLVNEALDQPLILVVDDDHDLCENLWQILRGRGYRVSLAHDGAEAARRLQEARHHVVLIDMKLPGGHGGDVLRMVRRANPKARSVLITGQSPDTDALVARVMDEGADAVCYKPFDMPQLLGVVHDLVASSDRSPA